MKKLAFFFGIITLCAAPLFAQTSTTQMKLAKDAGFIDRVSYSLLQQAHVVKNEGATPAICSGVTLPPGTPTTATCHSLRSAFASSVITAPASYAAVVAVSLVGQVNLLSGVITTCGGTPMVCTTDATDAAIMSQIATLWNALSGVL